jgi:hypothetical protein
MSTDSPVSDTMPDAGSILNTFTFPLRWLESDAVGHVVGTEALRAEPRLRSGTMGILSMSKTEEKMRWSSNQIQWHFC